jgi:hypothetical protein
MIILCRNAPLRLTPRLLACGKPCQRTYATGKKAATADDIAATPIAKQLKNLGTWTKSGERTRAGGRKRAKNALGTSEARRVNIVNQELCGTSVYPPTDASIAMILMEGCRRSYQKVRKNTRETQGM